MAALFECTIENIIIHLKNIFTDGELDEFSVTKDFSVTAADGKNYHTKHYNLDAIIAVGYRINTRRATAFRQWATAILRDYALRGYVIDRKREVIYQHGVLKLNNQYRIINNHGTVFTMVGRNRLFINQNINCPF